MLILFGVSCLNESVENSITNNVIESENNMSNGLVEVLMQSPLSAYTFVVDNTQQSVPLIAPGMNPILFNAFDQQFFAEGDNFNMLSVGIVLPGGYEIYESGVELTARIYFQAIRRAGGGEVLRPGAIILPFGQYEMSWGQFFDNSFINDDYSLEFIPSFQVSMVGIPDSENGKTYHVPVFCKVQHTLEMSN